MIGNIGYSLLALAVWLITSLAGANSAPDRMRFQHLLTSDGDADQQGIGAIKDILQDPEGFMWFAGEFGLARYDSHVFKFFYYDARNPNSLSSNFVSALVLDKSGTLWCGTSNGLNRYNRATENFDRYMDVEAPGKPRISSNAISSLAVDNANQLYIGTGAGLNVISANRDRILRYNYNPSISNSLSSDSVRSLFIDSHQQVWVGTIGGGLNLFDPLTKGFQRWVHSAARQGSIPTDDVERIVEDHLGRIWVATSTSGLSRLSADRQTFRIYQHDEDNPRSLGSNDIRDLFEDNHQNLWVSTDHGGLARYNPVTDDFDTQRYDPADPSSLRSNQVRKIYEDRNGNLWIGTFPDGINFYDINKSRFRLHLQRADNASSLPSDGILALFEDAGGTIWVGSEGGLSALDPVTGLTKNYKANPKDPHSLRFTAVSSIAEDPSGDLWVGTWSGGLHRFNRKTQQFKNYWPDPTRPNSIASPFVWQMKRDRQQNLWICFVDRGGFARYLPETDSFESYTHDPNNGNSLVFEHVFALTPDSQGNLWLGTLNGLDKFNIATKKFTHYLHNPSDSNSISSDHILATFEDSKGNIWLGTEGSGLSILDTKTNKFTHLTARDGLPSNAVTSIIEDRKGTIWLGTMNGVASFNPLTQRLQTYRKSDGFAGSSVNRNTMLLDKRGHLWVGSTGGITEFDPEDLKEQRQSPPVVLTGLRIANRPQIPGAPGSRLEKDLSHTNELQLSYQDVMFSIDYAALSYNSSERNQYSYKLEGFDTQWNEVGKERVATYTNISPGRYVFRVKAANSDGAWNEQGASLAIEITPPPWQSQWAYLGYAFLLALFLYGRRQYVALKRKTARYKVLSNTDPLTGIYNRAGIDQIITGLFINDEMKKGVCLMIFDIDHFKRINDKYGHAAGDRVLRELVTVVNANIRSGDHFARWGGEEFILLCSSTSLESACVLAEKIRNAVSGHLFDTKANPLSVTLSIGVTNCKTHDDFESTLKRADAALYRAKNNGRNLVEVGP